MFETLKSKIPLNWALLANPVNWVIVYVMIALAIAGLAFIITTPPAENEE
jgi:predicted membrane channel-forming protein YqfA (hemolysin III family)